MTETKLTHSEEQAKAQYEFVANVLNALDTDFDRLEEVRNDLASEEAEEEILRDKIETALDDDQPDLQSELDAVCDNILDLKQELIELETQAAGYEDYDEVEQAIWDAPLEICVRSGWVNAGDEMEAEEFYILLCTGGPAVRIIGELQDGQPLRAWLEHQDWGTPWMQYLKADQATLVQFAQRFFP